MEQALLTGAPEAKLHRNKQGQKTRKQPFHTLRPMDKRIKGGGRGYDNCLCIQNKEIIIRSALLRDGS